MFKVYLKGLNKTIVTESEINLFELLVKNEIPIASSCSDEIVCGQCYVEILNADGTLPPPDKKEKELLKKMNLSKNFRLSCAIVVNCNMTINTSYW